MTKDFSELFLKDMQGYIQDNKSANLHEVTEELRLEGNSGDHLAIHPAQSRSKTLKPYQTDELFRG